MQKTGIRHILLYALAVDTHVFQPHLYKAKLTITIVLMRHTVSISL
jgi:hypothetical protein